MSMTIVFLFNRAGLCTQVELACDAATIADLVNAGRAVEVLPRAEGAMTACQQGGVVTIRPIPDSFTPADFSRNELLTLYYVSQGMITKQISIRIGKKTRTIHGYIRRIKNRLNVDTRAQMVACAAAHGLIPDKMD